MKINIRRSEWLMALGLVVALVAALLMMNWEPAHSSTATFSTTHAKPTADRWAQLHGWDHNKRRMHVKQWDADGKLILKATYTPKQFKKIQGQLNGHGTGGTNSSMGRTKVTISTTGESTLGKDLYRDKVWIDWNWYRPDNDVTMNDQGRDWMQLDSTWQWNGWESEHHNYYQWVNNVPGSGYHKQAQGDWSGFCFQLGIICHHYPEEILNAHSNGTNEWWN